MTTSAKTERSRRSFLKAIGSAALTLPCYRLLESSAVEAQSSSKPPLRFLCIMTPHGTVYEYWRPPQATETSFKLDFPNSILAPLAPYQKYLNILDGLDMRLQSEQADDGHLGLPAFLTGVSVTKAAGQSSVPNSAESLDQYLARSIGGDTKFRSLELSLGDWDHYTTMSFDRTGRAVPRSNNPLAVFKRVFSGLSPSSAQPDPAATRRLAAKKSVLDTVQSELMRLQGRLGAAERLKLDQHLTAVRDIEARLSSVATVASCSAPVLPATPWNDKTNLNEYFAGSDVVQTFGTVTDLQLDMIAQAFACDLTRVATFQMLHSGAEVGMPYVDASLADVDIHASLAHSYSINSGNSVSNKLALIQRWFAGKVARLLQALSEIPEGSGSVLDNTIILWASDQGDPAVHAYNNLPIVLAGGAGGKFKMGRYLRYTLEGSAYCAEGMQNCGSAKNLTWLTAHNQLLVSICQAFGLSDQTFGWNGVSGPLPKLT